MQPNTKVIEVDCQHVIIRSHRIYILEYYDFTYIELQRWVCVKLSVFVLTNYYFESGKNTHISHKLIFEKILYPLRTRIEYPK